MVLSFPARVSAPIEPQASKGRPLAAGDVGQHHTSCRQNLWHSLTIFGELRHSLAISVKPAIFAIPRHRSPLFAFVSRFRVRVERSQPQTFF